MIRNHERSVCGFAAGRKQTGKRGHSAERRPVLHAVAPDDGPSVDLTAAKGLGDVGWAKLAVVVVREADEPQDSVIQRRGGLGGHPVGLRRHGLVFGGILHG